jgi:hypothetical protein
MAGNLGKDCTKSIFQAHMRVVHPAANLKKHCRALKQKDAFMNKFRCIICPFRTSKTAILGSHLEEHSFDEVLSALVNILPDLKNQHSAACARACTSSVHHPATPLWGCKFCQFLTCLFNLKVHLI